LIRAPPTHIKLNVMKSYAYFSKLKATIDRLDHEAMDVAVDMVKTTWLAGGQVITLGNGGSALTSLHFINDWVKSISMATGKPFRGTSLASNVGLLTAYANDISYDEIFASQLRSLLTPSDLVIAISGSGNSENVIRAVQFANENGSKTIGLCGYQGGRLKLIAQHVVWVPIDDMQISEDIHFHFGHLVMQCLVNEARGKS